MRVFFGLELAPPVITAVSDWRDRQFSCAARPVPPANFHITLAFVGELPESRMERLCLSVENQLAGETIPGATLTLNRTGYWHKSGIYWLGPDTWPGQLSVLARKLQGLSGIVGGKRDKRTFTPHVTLFRACPDAPAAPALMPAITLSYQHFTLFQSRKGKNGVSYHPLHSWTLAPESHY